VKKTHDEIESGQEKNTLCEKLFYPTIKERVFLEDLSA
jgi:hypothetical protein